MTNVERIQNDWEICDNGLMIRHFYFGESIKSESMFNFKYAKC